jgi:putative ABC transport system permease protein
MVSAHFFETIGIPIAHGRPILPEDDRPGANPVVVLGHEVWQRIFNQDPGMLNKVITLSGTGYTVVGIMPPGQQFPRGAQLWIPIGLSAASLADRGMHQGIAVIGRLKQVVSIEQARANMETIAGQLQQEYRSTNEGIGVNVQLLAEETVRDIKPSLLILLGAVGFVLLIACANVANLLLVRAAARQKEVALRTAIGAGRGRLIRQFLTENILLAIVGGVFGVLLAFGAIAVLKAITPVAGNIPRLAEVNIDTTVLIFTLLISVFTGVIFGIIPALQASRPDLNESLKEGSRTSTGGRHRNRLRSALVVAEIALALVVLIGGGLMIKGFNRLVNTDIGFNSEDILVMDLSLPRSRYTDSSKQVAFYDEFLKRVQGAPGLEKIGLVTPLAFTGFGNQSNSIAEGTPFARENLLMIDYLVASPNYFDAMGIQLRRGRSFNDFDNQSAPGVIIVDDDLAERFWPGQDPLGKRMGFEIIDNPNGPPTPIWREVIGVVGHVKHYGFVADARPHAYVPFQQAPNTFRGFLPPMTVIVRTRADQESAIAAVRSEVKALDPNLPLYNVSTMDELLDNSVARNRLSMLLMASFAVVGLLLAAVGIFGVVSYSVAQRTHEFGVRMALGAQRGQVLKMVLSQGMLLAVIGLVIGVAVSILLSPVLAQLVFGVSAVDPVTYLIISPLLVLIALFACYLAARKATKVDPLVALRYE